MQNLRKMLLLCLLVNFFLAPALASAGPITMFFTPDWQDKADKAKAIAEAMTQASGLEVQPRIAKTYPEIVDACTGSQPVLAYAGSFVSAILSARGISTPLLQGLNGKEFYTGVLIAPKSAGDDPLAIVKEAGAAVSYAKGASSGESSAKAASAGAAAVGTPNHGASVNAITAGKAKCAFVKNYWWEANADKYPDMKALAFPDVSDHKNPDNLLSANKAVASTDLDKIKSAATKNAQAFGVNSFAEFDPAKLGPSLELMKHGSLDPATYSW